MTSKIIHTWLPNEVAAFDFHSEDLAKLEALDGLELVHFRDSKELLDTGKTVESLITWEFESHWYRLMPSLRRIFTPAAGRDWIAEDPDDKVEVIHGGFHGPIMAESLLGAILFLNRDIPSVLLNQETRDWNRNLQVHTRRLAGETVLLIGYGTIGTHCAKLLSAMGCRVLGLQRQHKQGMDPVSGAQYIHVSDLERVLALADHVVLLLPGNSSTDRFLNRDRLEKVKPGACLYNFGRGNSLHEEDLLAVLATGQVGGAVLDVTWPEPLPKSSPLWDHPRVLVMPHSSCVCEDYKVLYINELCDKIPVLSD